MRTGAHEDLGLGPDLPHTSCALLAFIFWLDQINNPKARELLRQLLLWLGMLFDFGDWIDQMDSNPLETPLHKGPVRVRRIPLRFKEAIARTAARGDGFHSGRHMLHTMQHFRLAQAIKSMKAGNTWDDQTLSRYFTIATNWMRTVFDPVYSIAMDATTLSAKEFLFATMYAAGKACCCPPMVPRVNYIEGCNLETSQCANSSSPIMHNRLQIASDTGPFLQFKSTIPWAFEQTHLHKTIPNTLQTRTFFCESDGVVFATYFSGTSHLPYQGLAARATLFRA